jgi:eukaryotic-like serine/threonine-protein kinase
MPLEKLGPFKLEKLLGRGGMGAVYVGLNEATGERTAVKLLSGHLADDETFRERFKQEIETLKRLLHPHIVQLHGYGEEDGHLYYVMELVPGRSLQEELSAGRRFTWREVARLGIAIAQALKHAHDRGIIHRDLKPANLLLDGQDHLKLTDFGIAKLYGGANVTVEGGVLGTADYMAPEQAQGEQVTSRCDLYALGSVLYALLTGQPPFVGKTVVEVVTALQRDKPIPVRRLAPDTPEEFEAIVLQLLEKDPQKRVPTALAVANRLRAMEHGLSLETRIGDRAGGDDSPDVLPNEAQSSSAKTQIVNPSSKPTAPLKADDVAYGLAAAPTEVAGGGSAAAAANRTALGTQAGKKTGAGSDSGRGTQPAGAKAAESARQTVPPVKLSRFVTVSEDELRGRREAEESLGKQWGLVAVLALVGLAAIGGAIYMAVRRPSADRLYATLTQAADRGGAEELIPVEPELTSFLQYYADDPRAAEVKSLHDRLETFRWERQTALKSRRGVLATDATPLERAYQEALQLAGADPAAGLAHFEAILAVFNDAALPENEARATPSAQRWLDLSRQQVAKLTPEVKRLTSEQQAVIRQQLERAEQIVASDREAAQRIWRGILTLYQDKAWAHELVQEANSRLKASGNHE